MTTEPVSVRRQPLLAIPGWLLFGCLFLPTLRVCSDPVMPIEFPPSYAVYLGGFVIALLGGARLLRSRQRAVAALLTLWTLTAFAFLGALASGGVLLIGVIVGAVCIWFQFLITRGMIRTQWTERAIAIVCFLHALIATGWSALLGFSPDGMWGAHVAFGAGIVMMLVSAGMIARAHDEIVRKRREGEPVPLPEARAILRD